MSDQTKQNQESKQEKETSLTEGQETNEQEKAQEKMFPESYVSGLRKESGKYRTDLKAANKALDDLKAKYADIDDETLEELRTSKAKNMTTQEIVKKAIADNNAEWDKKIAVLTNENTELRNRNYKNEVESAIINAASKSGAVNPEQVYKQLNGNVQYDTETKKYVVIEDDGTPAINKKTGESLSIAELVEKFLQDEKNGHWVIKKFQGGSNGGGQDKSARNAVFNRNDIGSMDMDEYKKNRDKIMKAQKEGKIR